MLVRCIITNLLLNVNINWRDRDGIRDDDHNKLAVIFFISSMTGAVNPSTFWMVW